MKLQVPSLLWGMASPCLPCLLRAPPRYPSPRVGGSTDGCVPQSTRVPLLSPFSPFWVPGEAPCCCTAPVPAALLPRTVTCGLAGACFGGRPQRRPRAQTSDLCWSEAACRGGGWRGAFRGVQPSEPACGGPGVGGWLHPGCFTPLWDLRWVWFRGPVPPELLAAITLFNVEQRQDEELA